MAKCEGRPKRRPSSEAACRYSARFLPRCARWILAWRASRRWARSYKRPPRPKLPRQPTTAIDDRERLETLVQEGAFETVVTLRLDRRRCGDAHGETRANRAR